MNRQIYRVLVNTIAFFIAAQFLPIAAATPLHFLLAGIVLGLVNRIIRPILIILTIPINLISLGVFTLVINTLDDPAHQWVVAWLLRARFWRCLPCIDHR